jgi:phosphate/sulfate permease
MIRASVDTYGRWRINFIATSNKIPLSTTYVTFMVAMGTSLMIVLGGQKVLYIELQMLLGGWFGFPFWSLYCCRYFVVFLINWGQE